MRERLAFSRLRGKAALTLAGLAVVSVVPCGARAQQGSATTQTAAPPQQPQQSATPNAPQAQAAAASPTQAAAAPQTQGAAAIGPEFVYEVASIKPSDPSTAGYFGTSSVSDAYTAEGDTLKSLIISAYGLSGDSQFAGAPGWIDSARYDIRAKMEPSVADALKKLPLDERTLARQVMLQRLLADRFGLKVHRETKEFPIYVLTVAKNGPKLTPTAFPPDNPEPKDAKAAPAPPPPAPGPSAKKAQSTGPVQGRGTSWSIGDSGGNMITHGESMARFAVTLTRALHRQVVDKTGLTGEYDFTMQWTADHLPVASNSAASSSASPAAAPSASLPDSNRAILAALQEQLGLKLESTKGPVEIIAIDQISRPSPD